MRYKTYDVPVDGGNLKIGRWGDGGEVVLAAHGITGNHLHFAALADQLIPDFTVVAPDLRGRGRSSQIVGPFSVTAHADDLVSVLNFLGIEKATVVGHSMGAFVAILCADRYPDRVRNLVLVDGGIPLEIGTIARLPVDQRLACLIGPALDRLRLTFDSVASYLDYWRRHPALVDAWNTHIEKAMVYDLGGQPPTLRSTVREDAVIADAESEFDRDQFDRALKRLTVPATLLRAERGVLNQTSPLYPESTIKIWLGAVPALRSVTIPTVNHYTILLTKRGVEAVSDTLERSRR
ncbi:alpha/beta fold hydrolase [Candidatus Mycobacterium methanotrophicum]|uniref:Alpha/beta hydrolase n=1 Tax=Candidatus Mycobacterium methanotrophicum TaxID=2943498 RepID=A0ABY4QII8_9MYCO|nr:alpha/beta hydrolase [Candidatus Mycobacterium methanotrophicum]UQX10376.1 alpha/beta hydrolase [Candidatus Mycobacterium methanotrophicum]